MSDNLLVDFEISRLFLSLALLLSFALFFGQLFSTLKLPRVIGEICAGLILGPSFLGYFFPDFFMWIFSGFLGQQKILSAFYWLGLIFLMFSAGFRLPIASSREDIRKVFLLILGGLTAPLLFGWFFSEFFLEHMRGHRVAYALIFAIACSVTSIPVLSRIFVEIKIISTSFANQILTAAAIQDSILWLLLSVAIEFNFGKGEEIFYIQNFSKSILLIALFTIVMLFFAPKILRSLALFIAKHAPDQAVLSIVILSCLAIVVVGGMLGVSIVFGAMLAGIAIGSIQSWRVEQSLKKITDLSDWFFSPIYFAIVGFQVILIDNFDFSLIVIFLLLSSAIKISSVIFFLRIENLSWLRAFDYAMAMNTRGGPGIILASVAYASNIIDQTFFIALISTSLITSVIAGVWLQYRVKLIIGY